MIIYLVNNGNGARVRILHIYIAIANKSVRITKKNMERFLIENARGGVGTSKIQFFFFASIKNNKI